MLTEDMRSIIATYPLGFVASVNKDGTPNLSPKGTFVVLNDRQLVFGHIRSPGTVGNIAERPTIEINFLDVLARKAVRVRGHARMFSRSAPEFTPLFAALSGWKGYTDIMKGVVRVDIEKASLILSPAYDLGNTEAQLREQYRAKFTSL
jgi:predicted pyridoxine 5'-phosphate oxidase superfamily flavin-nucleotide-binding protein